MRVHFSMLEERANELYEQGWRIPAMFEHCEQMMFGANGTRFAVEFINHPVNGGQLACLTDSETEEIIQAWVPADSTNTQYRLIRDALHTGELTLDQVRGDDAVEVSQSLMGLITIEANDDGETASATNSAEKVPA